MPVLFYRRQLPPPEELPAPVLHRVPAVHSQDRATGGKGQRKVPPMSGDTTPERYVQLVMRAKILKKMRVS